MLLINHYTMIYERINSCRSLGHNNLIPSQSTQSVCYDKISRLIVLRYARKQVYAKFAYYYS